MKVNFSNVSREIKKFQAGGEMAPAEAVPVEAAPAEGAPAGAEQGGNPMDQILQAAMQAVQNNDAQLALQVCAALVQLAQGGAGAPEAAPAEGEPVYRRGGRLAYRRK